MEYFKFYDHSKNNTEMLELDEAGDLSLHVGTFAGDVLKEDDKSVTVGLIKWEMNGCVNYEYVYVLIKAEIIERWKIEGAICADAGLYVLDVLPS